MPRTEWLVEIQDHHEGYTSFEQYLKNLDAIERNRTNPQEAILSGPCAKDSPCCRDCCSVAVVDAI